jgi:hypothetical protein
MLAKAPQHSGEDARMIVQELASGLATADEPAALAATVSRYTAWQRQFFDQLIKEKTSPVERKGAESQPESIAQLRQELYAEFRQLRQELLAELDRRG